MHPRKQKQVKFSLWYVVFALIGIWLFQALIFQPMVINRAEMPYSEFLARIEAGEIVSVTLGGDRIYFELRTGELGDSDATFRNTVAVDDPGLIERLTAAGASFEGTAPTGGILTTLLGWIIPLLPLALIWYFMFRRMGQQGQGVMSIGKSKAREITGEMSGVKFADVGGVDEVEVELKEIIEFLKTPSRFTQLGAKLPKGVLLVGPPGTGKTLLAKATAGEAGVPFFSMSGSDFVEMFVGVGASRVRDLFEQAKNRAPCIVFIDEIDAIGESRSSIGNVGRNDEREQTLNQLLAEMDGFKPNHGVILMGATNRPEILDRALLRPGRFDRQIEVGLPTEEGRRQILEIHAQSVILGPDADLDRMAQITPGFSGADLANLVNEAALLAVRRGSEAVEAADLDLSLERVVAGLQRNVPLKGETRHRVAVHEAGHALVGQLLPNSDPIHRVSIIPTAKGALGYTMQAPSEDQLLLSKEELEERLMGLLGGRSAELLAFGEPSTGASDDLERATDLARRMVTEFGMSDALGPVRYARPAGYNHLGAQGGLKSDTSPEIASLIDRETRRLVEEAQNRALALLTENRDVLDAISELLEEREVITGDDVRRLAEKATPT